MQNNWPTKKLREVCEIEYGTRVVKSRNEPGKYYVYGGGGKTFTTTNHNREDRVIISRFGMSPNCVRRVVGKFFLNDSGLTLSAKNSNDLDTKYFDLFLFSTENEIYNLGRGQAQRNLSMDEFKEIEIPLPPISEQKKIVAKLEKLLAKTKEAKRLRAEAQKATQSLLSAELHKIFEEGKQKGWEEISFSSESYLEIIDGDRGKNYPKKFDFSDSGYCLFLNTSNVRRGSFNFSKCDFISKEVDERLRKGKLKRGDVILTTRGTLGNSAYYDKDVPYNNVRINSGMVIIRVNEKKILQRFLLYVLNSPLVIELIKEANSGSAQPQLPIRVLSKINFILPSLTEQKKIVERLDSLSVQIQKLQSLQNQTETDLVKLEQSILSRSFEN